jgi:hypothetical protein
MSIPKRWFMVIASLALVIPLASLLLAIPPALADGEMWNPTNAPLINGGQVNALAVDRSNSNILYAGVSAIETEEGDSTVYKSTDGGNSWTAVFTTENQLYALEAFSTTIYAGGTTRWSDSPSLYVSRNSAIYYPHVGIVL